MNFVQFVIATILVLRCSAHAVAQVGVCATDYRGSLGVIPNSFPSPSIHKESAHTQQTVPPRIIHLAVEADSKFYAENGASTELAERYARSLVKAVSRIFERELGVRLEITWIKIYTTASPDPYLCDGDGVILGERALAVWSKNTTVQRDVVLCLTSGGGGGIGYQFTSPNGGGLSALCTPSALAAASPFANTPMPNANFTYSVYIIAHELGHVLGAVHSHNCFWSPALDTCTVRNHPTYASGDACLGLPAEPRPNLGSLMSYCGGINSTSSYGYWLRMSFLDQIIAYLTNQLQSAGCILEPQQPVVMLLSPQSGVVAENASVGISWRTSGVDTVVVEYADSYEAGWKEIERRAEAPWDSLLFVHPASDCRSYITIRVRSLANSTVADTSDLPTFIANTGTSCLHTSLTIANGIIQTQCVEPEPGYGGNAGPDRDGNPVGAWHMANNSPIVLPNALGPETSGTMLLWFYTTTSEGVQHLIGSDWQTSATASLFIWQGTLGSAVWCPGTSAPIQAWANAIVPNTWYQAALTFNSSSQTLYLNGAIAANASLPSAVASHVTSLYVGKRGMESEPLQGGIDDVRVYGCELTADSIRTLYNAERRVSSVIEATPSEQFRITVSGNTIVVHAVADQAIEGLTLLDMVGNQLATSSSNTLVVGAIAAGVYGLHIRGTVQQTLLINTMR